MHFVCTCTRYLYTPEDILAAIQTHLSADVSNLFAQVALDVSVLQVLLVVRLDLLHLQPGAIVFGDGRGSREDLVPLDGSVDRPLLLLL